MQRTVQQSSVPVSHRKRLPPDSQQHLQMTSHGLCQTIGAPLGNLLPSLFLTLFSKNTHFIECHSGKKIGLQFLDLNLQNTSEVLGVLLLNQRTM